MSSASAPPGAPLGDAVELQGRYGRHSRSRRAGAHDRSPFVPLLILLLATLAWSVFQLLQLAAEAKTLSINKGAQEAPLAQAQRVRQALDALATETRKLADNGNANARLVLEELRKRGVTINPAGPAPGK